MGIPEYFSGKKILITGATGFIGKALVEKLLRSCPDVSTIYVVIRGKKESSPEERWAKITELALFDRLKNEQPAALGKVKTIAGESTADDFGISQQDIQVLIENVNIVFHVAASVRFTEELISALMLNVKSTYSIMEIARKMKNLECVLHTSTAFAHSEMEGEVEERLYESPLDWHVILKLVEDDRYRDLLPALQPKIMSGHQVTYTLTKRIAESLVEEYSQYFPVVLMRPGLVVCTIEDPFPGWMDAHNALTQLSDAVRQGYLRVTPADPENRLHIITLDLAIKAFLIATWKAHIDQTKRGISVYCESMGAGGADGKISFRHLSKYCLEVFSEYPAANQIWYPFCIFVMNPHIYNVVFFFLQTLPAILGDLIAVARGLNPRFYAMTLRLYIALTRVVLGFVRRDYIFCTDNYRSLDSSVVPEDKKDFTLDQSNFGAIELYEASRLGVVTHIYHEDLSPEALKKRKTLRTAFQIAHYSICTVLMVMCCSFVLRVYS